MILSFLKRERDRTVTEPVSALDRSLTINVPARFMTVSSLYGYKKVTRKGRKLPKMSHFGSPFLRTLVEKKQNNFFTFHSSREHQICSLFLRPTVLLEHASCPT